MSFSTLAQISIVLPVMAGIYNYNRIESIQKHFLFYLIFIGLADFFMLYIAYQKMSNLPFFHLFTLFEYLFFAYLYYSSVPAGFNKIIISTGTILYLFFNALLLIFYTDIFNFNHESRVFESFLLICYSLFYFNHLSKEISTSPDNFLHKPMFWVSLGVLLYFTGNFFLFSSYRYIAPIFPKIWHLHSALNILNNTLITLSFLCKPKFISSS